MPHPPTTTVQTARMCGRKSRFVLDLWQTGSVPLLWVATKIYPTLYVSVIYLSVHLYPRIGCTISGICCCTLYATVTPIRSNPIKSLSTLYWRKHLQNCWTECVHSSSVHKSTKSSAIQQQSWGRELINVFDTLSHVLTFGQKSSGGIGVECGRVRVFSEAH